MSCPCGKGPSLQTCCGPYLQGLTQAPTAEALMRSRYSAYVVGEIDYLERTHAPETRSSLDREGAERWSQQAEWKGLQVIGWRAGTEADSEGEVEFIAHYALQGTAYRHHERSRFCKHDGRWFYLDGQMVKPAPQVRSTPKVGRNDPCPCGSGKKYKKCCGL